ncbi:MAG: dockerin type I repeat-containing protein [Clostridia bacterium]|nr:dockerin type I repeat-containing protein [Clostridia bacterium]
MKRTFALALSLILLMGIVHTPALAAGENADGKAWTYDNSLIVTVNVAEEKTFTPEDFPEVEVEELYVFGESATDTGYSYDILLVIDVTAGWYYMTMAENSLKQNPAVVKIERNRFAADYKQRESDVKLNKPEISIKVGESANLYLASALVSSFTVLPFGISLRLDPDFTVTDDYLLAYGLEMQNDNYAVICDKNEFGAADYISILNDIYSFSEIKEAEIDFAPLAGNSLYEEWSIENNNIASLSIEGGIEDETGFIYRTATVTGISAGTTYVTINHGGVKDTCIINVYNNSGDVTGDGKVTSLDAAMILRYDAGLEAFDDLAIAAADYNGDGKVTSLDAALVLRYDAGL